VYGCRSEEISSFNAFHERWLDLTVWTCEWIHLQIEIPGYNVTKSIAERYYLAADTSTIFIPKQYENMLTVSLGNAVAKLFDMPDIAPKIDKVLSECDNEELLDDVFAVIWNIPKLPLDWKEGLMNAIGRCEEDIEFTETCMSIDPVPMDDVRPTTETSSQPPRTMDALLVPQVQVEIDSQSRGFGTLVASMADLFDSITHTEIARRLPNQLLCGQVNQDVNSQPISEEVLQKYDTELERSVFSSTVNQMTIDRIEGMDTGTQSGILGEYFVRPQIVSLIQIYLLFNKLLDCFDYKNWTSCKREIFNFPRRQEGDSDFLYLDRSGELARLLGLGEPATRGDILYYLEVKSTKLKTRSFRLSQNQLQMVQSALFLLTVGSTVSHNPM